MRTALAAQAPVVGEAPRPRPVAVSAGSGERIAVFLDLENLLFPFQEAGAVDAGIAALTATLQGFSGRGNLVYGVAVCNKTLAKRWALVLAPFGIRTYVHQGGTDAADHGLLQRISADLPPSCGTIVIGSGDGIFVDAAVALRAEGRRVEAIGVPGTASSALRFVAEAFHRLVPGRSPLDAAS